MEKQTVPTTSPYLGLYECLLITFNKELLIIPPKNMSMKKYRVVDYENVTTSEWLFWLAI